MIMRRKTRIRTEPFTDLLFNTLLGFTFLFFITVLFINPISKIGNVNMKAEYIVTVDWKDSLPDDVDIWVQDPNGETVSYLKKDAGWLHLDRDDQGIINDVVTIDGEEIIYPINREVVTLRGIIPGEYILIRRWSTSQRSLSAAAAAAIEARTLCTATSSSLTCASGNCGCASA